MPGTGSPAKLQLDLAAVERHCHRGGDIDGVLLGRRISAAAAAAADPSASPSAAVVPPAVIAASVVAKRRMSQITPTVRIISQHILYCIWWALRGPLNGQPGTMASPQGALIPSP
jgi:hypothetical protein